MPGRAGRGGLAALLAGACVLAASTVVADELEYPVKVEFIERFTRFISWPSEAFHGPDAPFTLCVLGESAISPYLERLARERRLKDRRVEVKRLKSADELPACHLAFIAAGERPRLKQILTHSSGRPVLTVGDAEGFAKEGVIINLFLDEEGHVRFEISPGELRKSGLKASAQLLRLARMVSE